MSICLFRNKFRGKMKSDEKNILKARLSSKKNGFMNFQT